MSRIKIENLPQDQNITQEEMKRIKGGVLSSSLGLFPKLDGFDRYLKIEAQDSWETP